MNRIACATLDDLSFPIKNELLLFEEMYTLQFQTESSFLKPLLNHISQEKGKRLRPILFFLSQGLLRKPNPASVLTAVILELLHTASLIHDDIVDKSSVRRGKPTLNSLWGNHISVLLGDFLFAKVLQLGVSVPQREVLSVISDVVLDMGRGELRQMLTSNERFATEEEYYQIAREKTGGLFSAACLLGGVMAGASMDEKKELEKFGGYFGTLFQIRDDILDFAGKSSLLGKPVGQDLINGKITLPLILAFDSVPQSEKQHIFKKILSSFHHDGEWLKKFVKETGGIQNAQKKAQFFSERALALLNRFNHSVYRDSLKKIVAYQLKRGI